MPQIPLTAVFCELCGQLVLKPAEQCPHCGHRRIISPRRFELLRCEDVSGVSGTGVVADGVAFDDGVIVLHWRGAVRSTVVYQSAEEVLQVHGHGGRTEIHWLE